MSDNFKVDTRHWNRKSRDIIKALKIDEPAFVKSQASLLAKSLSKVTPPFLEGKFPEIKGADWQDGKVKEVLIAGERAIKHDLGVIFRVRKREYLEFLHDVTGSLVNVRRELKTKSGQTYLVDVDEINYDSTKRALAFHAKKRLANGRVSGYQKGGKDSKIGRWKNRDVMWVTEEIWQSVYNILALNIGYSKAAFGKVATRLGVKGKKAPVYMRKHFAKVPAHITFKKNPARVTMKTAAPGLAHTKRQLKRVENFRIIAMEKRLETLLRANAKKAGFKVKKI